MAPNTLVFGAAEAKITNVDNIAGLSVAEITVAGGYTIFRQRRYLERVFGRCNG